MMFLPQVACPPTLRMPDPRLLSVIRFAVSMLAESRYQVRGHSPANDAGSACAVRHYQNVALPGRAAGNAVLSVVEPMAQYPATGHVTAVIAVETHLNDRTNLHGNVRL